jgi:aromatic-L-amino-acid/L-tryptophan decarboxylase
LADTLGMSGDHMRALGRRVVDAVVDHIEQLGHAPALAASSPTALRAQLGPTGAPRGVGDADSLLAVLTDVVLSSMQHGDHPRYFARVPGPSSFAAVAADWLSTGFNAIAASWGGGSGPTAVELVVTEWLAELMGLPSATEGVLLSGGSMANLAALAVARHELGEGVVYFSDQAHSCVPKALHLLGVPAAHRRVLATGDELRLRAEVVRRAIEADRGAGLRPRVLVATAGTTNTGAVDELSPLADLAAEHSMWFHVDGAYGGPARLVAECAAELDATSRADSFVLDPHKWLFQPYDVGCLLVSRPGALERCFAMNPEYLADVIAEVDGEVDLRNRGPELTRRARALKLWFTISLYGVDHLARSVGRGVQRAEAAEQMLRADPAWTVVTPAQLGIVTFVRSGADDAAHQRAARSVTESGYAALTCTQLGGRQVLRLCTINPRTTDDDIAETLRQLAAACDAL